MKKPTTATRAPTVLELREQAREIIARQIEELGKSRLNLRDRCGVALTITMALRNLT